MGDNSDMKKNMDMKKNHHDSKIVDWVVKQQHPNISRL